MLKTPALIAVDKDVVVEVQDGDEKVYPKLTPERKAELVKHTRDAIFTNKLATYAGVTSLETGRERHSMLKRGLEIVG